ncbi:MAG: zinc ribbon domain-containing protein [Actinomycetota bacterium]
MKCPKCGADNPESAEFCSLCMERISQPGGAERSRISVSSPGGTYTAPGEWRGDAEVLRPEVSRVVVEKVHRYRIKLAVYGVVIALIVTWLVLSFTVWGNPDPGQRTMKLFGAVNARDEGAFVGQFQEQDSEAARTMYSRVVSYLGDSGSYSGLELDVVRDNDYDAVSYIEGGTVQAGGGYERALERSDGLMVVMENHKGVWYVIPTGTDLIP